MGIEAPGCLELPSWHAWVELSCPISLHCDGQAIQKRASGASIQTLGVPFDILLEHQERSIGWPALR